MLQTIIELSVNMDLLCLITFLPLMMKTKMVLSHDMCAVW